MMSPPKSIIFIILIISLSLSLCFCEGDVVEYTKKPKVAGFRLALLWPPAFCNLSHRICDQAKVKPEFTIHGLWPYDINTISLIDCPNASPFDVNNVKDFRADLDGAWPAYDRGRNEDFWKREWDKHGSCSENVKYPNQILLPQTNYFRRALTAWDKNGSCSENVKYPNQILLSQTNYFRRALTAWTKLKLTSTLKKAGIIPDNRDFSVQDIINAVAGKKKLNPVVVCKTNNVNQVLLSEIYVCMDKKAQSIISCKAPLEVSCGGVSAKIKFLG